MRGYWLRLCQLLVFNIKSSQLEVLLEKSFLKELRKFIENTCIRFLVYSFLNFCQEKRTPSQFFFREFCDIFDNSSLLKHGYTASHNEFWRMSHVFLFCQYLFSGFMSIESYYWVQDYFYRNSMRVS